MHQKLRLVKKPFRTRSRQCVVFAHYHFLLFSANMYGRSLGWLENTKSQHNSYSCSSDLLELLAATSPHNYCFCWHRIGDFTHVIFFYRRWSCLRLVSSQYSSQLVGNISPVPNSNHEISFPIFFLYTRRVDLIASTINLNDRLAFW